jgi:sulfotransferase family protein
MAPSRGLAKAWHERMLSSQIETFCMFIGYPCSGHSLVGALLDAHPEAVIAHELNALSLFSSGMKPRQLYRRILENERAFVAGGANPRPGYELSVPGAWQGRLNRLRVIGDKNGGESTKLLAAEPDLVPRLERKLRVPVRAIHVVRNPYDNIASRKNKGINKLMPRHFALVKTNAKQRRRLGDRVMDVRHEDFVAHPRERLAELCRFVGLEPTPDYLEACAQIVFASPHQSRHEVDWPPKLRAKVDSRIARYDFLAGYSFDA